MHSWRETRPDRSGWSLSVIKYDEEHQTPRDREHIPLLTSGGRLIFIFVGRTRKKLQVRRIPAKRMGLEEEPLLLGHPWLAAVLLGTLATPAAVIIAVPAPRPLDAVFAWPLVLLDIWVGSNIGTPQKPVVEGTPVHLVALVVGIAFTWLFYVLLARLVVWRLAGRRAQDE
jgi:hypothetical protein